MSIQGCAAAMSVVEEVREVIKDCTKRGLRPEDVLELVEFTLDDIFDTAEKGYW